MLSDCSCFLLSKKSLYSQIITNFSFSGNLFSYFSFLFEAFPACVHLSCLTVYYSSCPMLYRGVWLASRFLWTLHRHPPRLPA